MKKHLLFSFFLLLFISQASIAQTYIWGGPGDKNSEFNGGLNDWTTVSIQPNDKALWTWKSNGKPDQGNYTKTYPAIVSNSVSNGAAIFDSDFLDNNGNGAAPGDQVSELISPTFSCVGRQNAFLKFNCYTRNFDALLYYSISLDGGTTWDTPVQLVKRLPLYEYTLPNYVEMVDISKAVGSSNVKVKFIWGGYDDKGTLHGSYYFWMIDDVSVVENPGNDAFIDGAWYPSIWFGTPRDFVDQDSMYFMAYVLNRGSSDISDAKAKITLTNTSKNISYFTDSLTFSLGAGDTTRLDFKSFMPKITMDTGFYKASYEVISANSATQSGKVYDQYFRLYPNLKVAENSYVNKISTSDTRHGRSITWQDGSTLDAYTINYYRTPNWVDNPNLEVQASSCSFTNGGGPTDFSAAMYVWAVDDTVNNQFYNFDLQQGLGVDGVDPTQLEYVGYGSENITGYQNWSPHDVPLFNLDDDNNIKLSPNKKYLFGFYWPKNYQFFYVYDNWYSSPFIVSNQRYYDGGDNFGNTLDQRVSFLYMKNSAGTYQFFTLGEYSSWSMDVSLAMNMNRISSTHDDILPDNSFFIENNPISNDLNLNINLSKTEDKISITVCDLKGSLIHIRTLNEYSSGNEKFYMGNLPNGEYIVTLFTHDKLLSKKFTIVK